MTASSRDWRLQAEILVLRHKLNALQQRAPRRLHLRWAAGLIFVPAKLGMDRVEEITIKDGRLLAGKDLTFIESALRAVHSRSPKAYDQSTSEPLPQPALSASPRRLRPRALTEYEREQSRLWGLQQIRSEPILRRLMWGLLELTELLIAHMGDRFRK